MSRLLVVGTGGAGCLAAARFPHLDDFEVSHLLIDWPEALADLNGGSSHRVLALRPAASIRSRQPKTADATARAFAKLQSVLTDAVGSADAAFVFAGLAGVTGSVAAVRFAELASGLRCPVLANIYLPFVNESETRKRRAAEALPALAAHCQLTSILNLGQIKASAADKLSLTRTLDALCATHLWHATDVLRIMRQI